MQAIQNLSLPICISENLDTHFNLHVKFTLIKQLSNIHTTDKGTLKFQLKRREDFWIQKTETLTPNDVNQELHNV